MNPSAGALRAPSASDNPWIAPFGGLRPGAPLRLFCFPFAGGSASVYRTWSERLPEWVSVLPVQLPGRETRLVEEPFTRIDALVRASLDGLAPLLQPPFAFFGHSMGGLVAFELTRMLRRVGRPEPVQLLISSFRGPNLPQRWKPMHELPDTQFIERLRDMNGTPDAILEDAELMELLLPLLRADFAVCATYRYRDNSALSCPISVFGGSADTHVPVSDLAEWQRHTRGQFSLDVLEGDHFYLEPRRDALLALVESRLHRHVGPGIEAA